MKCYSLKIQDPTTYYTLSKGTLSQLGGYLSGEKDSSELYKTFLPHVGRPKYHENKEMLQPRNSVSKYCGSLAKSEKKKKRNVTNQSDKILQYAHIGIALGN